MKVGEKVENSVEATVEMMVDYLGDILDGLRVLLQVEGWGKQLAARMVDLRVFLMVEILDDSLVDKWDELKVGYSDGKWVVMLVDLSVDAKDLMKVEWLVVLKDAQMAG